MDLDSLFPPSKPRHTGPGQRVWVRHGSYLITSYEIDRLEYKNVRISSLNNSDYGPGWVIYIKNEEKIKIPLSSIADPDGVCNPWGSGGRYLRKIRDGLQFVRVG